MIVSLYRYSKALRKSGLFVNSLLIIITDSNFFHNGRI